MFKRKYFFCLTFKHLFEYKNEVRMRMAPKQPRYTCAVYHVDCQKLQGLQEDVAPAAGLARIFKALADETRIKIVYALYREELCVCEVAEVAGVSVACASHHLRLLSSLGLAAYRREGKMVYYSLQDDCIKKIVEAALKHYRHDD